MPRCFLPTLTLLAALILAVPAEAATRYVSPSGSDSGSCTASSPCRSLNRGYQVAHPGDVVQVAGGSYGGQRIAASSKGAPRVTIRPAPGARPVLGDLEIAASHLNVLGPMQTRAMETANTRGAHVTDTLVQDIDVDGQGTSETPAWIAAVNGVTWRRVNVHNARDANALLFIDGSYPSNGSVKNLTIEDSRFHDVTVPAGSDTHSQCIYMAGTQGMTVRRSHFWNCAIFDIFQSGDVDTTSNMLIENNVFEAPRLQGGDCCAYFTVRFAWGIPDHVVIRNNSSEHQMDFRLGAVASRVVGNTIQSGIACADGVRFSHNVVTKTDPCSSTDRRVRSIGYKDPGAHEFELDRGSPAINAGDPSDHPATDIDGLGRRGPPDAGAYEFDGIRSGGSAPPPVHRRNAGLVGAWSFNEGSGRVAADHSGRGNLGRIFGAARVAGRFGRALRFDGSNDFVAVRDSASLDFKRGMTLEAWVKPTAGPRRWRPVIVKQRKSGAAYGLFTAGRKGRASARLRTTHVGKLAGRPSRGGGAWKHVATTWNGKVLRLYVNGRLVAKKRLSKRAAKSAGRLLIGGSRGGSFKGLIDEVRIYRRALKPAEIRADRVTPIG